MDAVKAAAWRADDWSDAFARHFFGPQSAQLPVLFFVDEALLAELHPSRDREAAVISLGEAVQAGLSSTDPRGYFDAFEREGRKWKLAGGDSRPPFLHLLAICVLAATRMGTSDEVASTNYRHHLCRLLDVPDIGMPAGFRDSLYYLWGALSWWLDERHKGRLGLSTIVEDKRFAHIGYPISQTLFRRSDVRQLDDFFRWMGLRAQEQVDEDVLVAHFRAWAPERGLAAGAMRMLKEPQFDPAITRIISSYARQWDGTRSDRTGPRRAAMRLVIEAHPTISAALRGLRPAGYPDRLQGSCAGRAISAEAQDGVFDVLCDIDPSMLARGIRLGSEACELVFEGADVHVLRLDSELGGWASVDFFEPGERHWLLISPEHRDDVLQQLNRSAADVGRVVPGPGGLRRWTLVRNVVFGGAANLSGALAMRRPSHRHRFALRGGLPLAAASAYLAGGAPDAWLPAASHKANLTPTLDGNDLPRGSEQFRLAEVIGADPGAPHTISWSGATRSFVTIASARRFPPNEGVPMHALYVDGEGHVRAHRAASASGDGDAHVRGALVEGASVPWRPAPVLLNRRAQAAWLLGRKPGQVLVAPMPRTPTWLARTGLMDRLYEARAEFETVWVVERWRLAPELRVRPVIDLAPEPESAGGRSEQAQWSRLLQDATLTLDDPLVAERLQRYRAITWDTARTSGAGA